MATLFWMTDAAVIELHTSILANLERYRTGDFGDLGGTTGWQQKALLEYDTAELQNLTGNSANDLDDALVVFETLSELEPRLATCRNVWVHLAHTEFLEYGRKRWLKEGKNISDEDLKKSIDTHIFKGGITGCRDDNVVGRLWWTGYIGSRMAESKDPDKIREMMAPFMRTTDTRSSVIERSGVCSECGLARHISEYLTQGKLKEAHQERAFRDFIISINFKSNGLYFGDMSQKEVFKFLDHCR